MNLSVTNSSKNYNPSFCRLNGVFAVGTLKKNKKQAHELISFVRNHAGVKNFAVNHDFVVVLSQESALNPFAKGKPYIRTKAVLEVQSEKQRDKLNLPYIGHGDSFESSREDFKKSFNKFSQTNFSEHLSTAESGKVVISKGWGIDKLLYIKLQNKLSVR